MTLRLRLLTLALMLFAVAHALYAAWDQDWTWDEGVRRQSYSELAKAF